MKEVIDSLNNIEASLVSLRLKDKKSLSMDDIGNRVFSIELAVYTLKKELKDKQP